MSEQLYSIKESTLIDIADALRRRHGETEIATVIETVDIPSAVVSKTNNATGFNTWEGQYTTGTSCDVVKIDGATSIKVKMAYQIQLSSIYNYVQIASGEYTVDTFPKNSAEKYGKTTLTTVELVFKNTDVVTFYRYLGLAGNVLGYYAECYALDENGNQISGIVEIEVEKEVKKTYRSNEMAQAIDDIEAGSDPIVEAITIESNGTYTAPEGVDGYSPITVNVPQDGSPPDEAFLITGSCSYKFAYGSWDWFLRQHGNKITTKDIISPIYMFHYSNINEIPFDINLSYNCTDLTSIFSQCRELTSAPLIKGTSDQTTNITLTYLFNHCWNLKAIPYDYFYNIGNDDYWAAAQKTTSGSRRNYMFTDCYSLRQLPDIHMLFTAVTSATYSLYNSMCNNCYALDEITNLPVNSATLTSNHFSNTFYNCNRLKNVIFTTQKDGTPYVARWKSQTIDLSTNVGYDGNSTENYLKYNSGITRDKEVVARVDGDDTTYQTLKNDPDWYTTSIKYSRYNKDSAVATINSLPDTSAYLATQSSGTNTIKFKGEAGSATDGGAINTLTEEEIAVATAKGWTVTLS